MKIVIADELSTSAVEVLAQIESFRIDNRPGRSLDDLRRSLVDAEALVVRSATKVDRALIEQAPALRVIARAGTGVDNVDVSAASERGILVVNSPGANSISVAEHACALMLSLARAIPTADAAMKRHSWDKKGLTGAELRGKTLGIVGLGRIGQEVAQRARSFGMEVIAHDPFISVQVAQDLGVVLHTLDDVFRKSHYITLHLPSTAATRGVVNKERLALCQAGVRIINTARGDLIDEPALIDALGSGQVGGAALDVFGEEPPRDWQLAAHPAVIATPHIAASTKEAQELVGIDTVLAVKDYLVEGIVRNAVNFPSIGLDEYRRLRPFLLMAERLGSIVGQMGEARINAVGLRYYGEIAQGRNDLLGPSVLVGLFKPILSTAITAVNARAMASGRGIELVESRSTRTRDYTSLLSVKVQTDSGERWMEGTVFATGRPRLVSVSGIPVEAPLEGTLLVLANNDEPGVIGLVGTILGSRGINIANFALGRNANGAIGIVNLDTDTEESPDSSALDDLLKEVRKISAVREAWLIRLA
jgi:D-3-phosphoglycerate dehydrogenase